MLGGFSIVFEAQGSCNVQGNREDAFEDALKRVGSALRESSIGMAVSVAINLERRGA